MIFDFSKIQFKNVDGSPKAVTTRLIAEALHETSRTLTLGTIAQRIYFGTPFEITPEEVAEFLEYLNSCPWFFYLKAPMIEYLQQLIDAYNQQPLAEQSAEVKPRPPFKPSKRKP